MRVLLDTNILLDALLVTRPENPDARALIDEIMRGEVTGVITPAAFATVIHYLQRNSAGLSRDRVIGFLHEMLDTMVWASMLPAHFRSAFASSFDDLEDGAQFFAALSTGKLDAIVTRDPKDFKDHVHVPVLTPAQCLKRIR